MTTREEILSRIAELNKVSFAKPTAMELHSKRAMLSRAQRMENERYRQKVLIQRANLIRDLANIDTYLQSVLLSRSVPQETQFDVDMGFIPTLKETKLKRYTQRKKR